ncbi:MAG TPA: extracellular solute-binding protein [Beijerinckiaceae bacterium]|nr:extracellular solute-binding protein [Beijerinckiaceae bacterium]
MNRTGLTDWAGGICAAAMFVSFALAAGSALALTNDEIFNYQGADRDKMLEEGARKEGSVVLYSSMIVNQVQRPIAEAFHAKYPFIDIKYWRGTAEDIVAKVQAETQAHNAIADVVEGSGLTGGVDEAHVAAPFTSKYSAILPPSYIAPDRTAITTRFRYIALGYNTRYVSKDEAPKTYQDLLDPKWKGKMAWAVGSGESGALIIITALRAAWGEAKADDYFSKLAPQQIASLAVSNRAVMDAVVSGQYWIGLGISAHHPIISASKGAPSATVLLDPVPALSDAIQVLKATKHPYSAMLLVDFMLSPQVQTMLQKAEYFPSNPDVQPADILRPIVPRNAGVPQIDITPEMSVVETPKSAQLFQKYFR